MSIFTGFIPVASLFNLTLEGGLRIFIDMISYTPLQTILKKNGESLHRGIEDGWIAPQLGMCNTRSVVTRTSTIDKICKRLGCKVEEVVRIEADDTKMRSRVKYLDSKVDFAPMFKIIEGKGLSMRGVSMAAGVSENTVQKIKAQNADCGAKPLYATVRKLARYLEVEPEDLYTVVGPV